MLRAVVTTLLLGTVASVAPPVQVQQFGMCQCPMTSTWFSAFFDGCLKGKPSMMELVNFTQFYVGGKHGGHVTSATWNSSFHGYDEVMGDRFQLCAKELGQGAAWLKFQVSRPREKSARRGPGGSMIMAARTESLPGQGLCAGMPLAALVLESTKTRVYWSRLGYP